MNQLIPKGQRKMALGFFLGLVPLTAVMSAVELSSSDLELHQYLIEVGAGAIFGAIGGALFGYVAWVGLTVVRQVIGAIFDNGQTLATVPNLDGMSASSQQQEDIRERIAARRIRELTSMTSAGFR